MAYSELDSYYIKAIGSLHTSDTTALQKNLEEAIKSKSGIIKDYATLVAISVNQRAEELKPGCNTEETKTTSSSDNELELDLLKEDLMCVVCKGMDIGARNRLLECSDCHSLYHQECHHPPVVAHDIDGTWTCHDCKDTVKKIKKHSASSSSCSISSTITNIPAKLSQSTRAENIVVAPNFKVSNVIKKTVPVSTSLGKLGSSGKVPSSSSSISLKPFVTPNINIVSADKRIQIMKKKAAKQHEKRKLSR